MRSRARSNWSNPSSSGLLNRDMRDIRSQPLLSSERAREAWLPSRRPRTGAVTESDKPLAGQFKAGCRPRGFRRTGRRSGAENPAISRNSERNRESLNRAAPILLQESGPLHIDAIFGADASDGPAHGNEAIVSEALQFLDRFSGGLGLGALDHAPRQLGRQRGTLELGPRQLQGRAEMLHEVGHPLVAPGQMINEAG